MAESSAPKVNLLILASSLWIGGAETVIRHLAQGIDRRRFNVTVCVLKQRGHIGDEMVREGIDVVCIGESGQSGVDYLTSLKLRRILRARRIDIVHTHTTHGLVDATVCRLLMPGLKVVHTFHFGNYPHTKPRILWMERVFSRFANRLFAVGEQQRSQLKTVYGYTDRRLGMVWNGVALPHGSGDAGFRSRVGAEGRILIGTIATLIEQKGLRDLMRVARKVKDSGARATFVIVGEGQLRKELEAMRRELDLDDTVVLTGWVTDAATLALPVFDIFFQPSLWEAMSVVILEAMGAGKPIIATRTGETGNILEDGVDGLLVDPKDVDGMAAAVGRCIADLGLRQRLGDAARRRVVENFTLDHMARSYERIYLDTVGQQ